VPRVDPWGRDRGRLLQALSVCGAVYLEVDSHSGTGTARLPDPSYAHWLELWREATAAPPSFWRRDLVSAGHLKFSRGEDLLRTLAGSAKAHVPDVRYNFGLGQAVFRCGAAEWGDLAWIVEGFRGLLDATASLAMQEILAFAGSDEAAAQSLCAKLRAGREAWGSSRLRHCIYPVNGSCTEHSDYGVITVQQSSSAGLHARIFGKWLALDPPDGCAVAFAGDMLEILTNGRIQALRHRVCLETLPAAASGGGCMARQSHILFLQPDRDTVVAPLRCCLRGDGTDLSPIRYGDWHNRKASLAHVRF